MSEGGPTGLASRTAFLWVAGVMLVVMTATLTAFAIVVLVSGDDPPAPRAGAEDGTPPAVSRAVALRSGPAGDTAIVARLDAGDPITIVGRNEDATWLLVEPLDRSGLRGWIELDAVDPPPPIEGLAIAAAPDGDGTPTIGSTSTPTGALPTFSPDLPDLAIDRAFSRDNRLTVVITNVGIVDVTSEILLSLDGADPVRLDVKPGEPLRPDQQLEVVLEDEYVQRRAVVRLEVFTDPPIEEQSTANNSLETVVAPDLPNDLGIMSAALDGPDGALRVSVQNLSEIPLTGGATLTVRERTGNRTRLGTAQPVFEDLPPGAQLAVDFPELVDLQLDAIEVLLTSDAINDANSFNNIYPP